MNIGPITCYHRKFVGIGAFPSGSGAFFRGISQFLSCLCSDFSVGQAFANKNELPKEKGQLADRNNDQPERENPTASCVSQCHSVSSGSRSLDLLVATCSLAEWVIWYVGSEVAETKLPPAANPITAQKSGQNSQRGNKATPRS